MSARTQDFSEPWLSHGLPAQSFAHQFSPTRRGSLAFARAALDLDCYYRLVVECFHARGMFRNGFENVVDHAIGRLGGAPSNNFFYARTSEQFAAPIAGVENTVAEEDEQVPGLGPETEFVVFRFVEQSQ